MEATTQQRPPNTAANAAPPKRMTLSAVVKGKIKKPHRIVLFGQEGVGKTLFAADAPSPIFICSEAGTEHVDTSRFPAPHAWSDVIDACELLLKEKHSYETVVIDTLDWLEPFCWAETCAKKLNAEGKRVSHPDDYGYGKGYLYALDTWRQLLWRLDQLRDKRNMNVVLLAHSQSKTFKSPDTEDYQRYELKLDAKACGLIKEWPDAVLFAAFETYTHKQNNRHKGIATGERVIYTSRTAAYDAKNRMLLPEKLPLSWAALAEAMGGVAPSVWRERVSKALETAKAAIAADDAEALAKHDAFAATVMKTTNEAGEDADRLAKIANRLSVALSNKETK